MISCNTNYDTFKLVLRSRRISLSVTLILMLLAIDEFTGNVPFLLFKVGVAEFILLMSIDVKL